MSDTSFAADSGGEFPLTDYSIDPDDQALADEITNFDPVYDTPGPVKLVGKGTFKLPEQVPLTSLPPKLAEPIRQKLLDVPPASREARERELVAEALYQNSLSLRVQHGAGSRSILTGKGATIYQQEYLALAGDQHRLDTEYLELSAKLAAIDHVRHDLARSSKANLLDRGYSPPVLREYDVKPRAAVTDLDGFNARMDDLKEHGGAFGNLVALASRAGAGALNTVDALGNASMKLFVGATDDWGRAFVQMKETYAQSARFAFREAVDQGLHGDEAVDYALRRARELAEMPSSAVLERVEDTLLSGGDLPPELRFLANRDKLAENEAARVLFMDGPQTSFGRTSAKWAAGVDKMAGLGLVEGVVMPYIRTPIRLFERGLVSYTPWGKASEEMQAILRRGGPDAEIARAQIEMGMHAISAGLLMGALGFLEVTNGKPGNTSGLDDGPPNHLNIGNAYIELGRLDPFSLTVTIGGMVGQAIREGFEDGSEYDAEEGIATAIQIGFLAAKDGVLSKSYLTGVRDLVDTLFSQDVDTASGKLARIVGGTTQRLIPLSGTSRTANDTLRSNAPEAITWADQMLRAVPGAGMYLPVRRDILGDPVKGRKLGIAAGLTDTTADGQPLDSVKETLRDLRIDLQDIRRTDPRGFRLTAKQLDELRRIRGHEAVNGDGLTMREALGELLDSAQFQALPSKEQKKDEVAEVIRAFNEPARQLLEDRDPTYASNRVGHKALAEYMAEGLGRDEAREEAADLARELGLPPPTM